MVGDRAEVRADIDEAGPDINAALPDEEFPEHALPALLFCADKMSSGDLEEV